MQIKRRFGSKAMTELVLDGDTMVLFSYETAVASHVNGELPRVTKEYYSRTTTGHVNRWLEYHDFSRDEVVKVDPDYFTNQIERRSK